MAATSTDAGDPRRFPAAARGPEPLPLLEAAAGPGTPRARPRPRRQRAAAPARDPRSLAAALAVGSAIAAAALATLGGEQALAAAAFLAGVALATGAFALLARAMRPSTVPHGPARAVTDAAGRLLFADDAFAELASRLGQGPGATPFTLAAPADRCRLYVAARRAANGEGASAPLLLPLSPADGGPPLAVLATVAPAGEGRLAFFLERGAARTAAPGAPDTSRPPGPDGLAAAADAFVAALVAACPGPVAAVAADGSVVASTDAFAALAAPGGAARLDDVAGEGEGEASRLLAPVLTGSRERLEVELPGRADGGRIFRLSARRLDGPGHAPLAIVALTDVTRQSALEAQFAQGQKLQAIGQLAGGVAHDFNNVLTAIIGFSDLLLQSHRPSDPSFRDIMNIRQSAQRAAGLVRQLLAFSRRQTLRPTSLDVNDVLADLSVMLDRLLGERVTLKIAYGRDIARVMADLSQLEQVVINLAVNARDAMPGGGTLSIATRTLSSQEARALDPDGAVKGEAVLIEVADTGCGIAPDIIDRIFDPFFTTKEIGEGTGLGLSTVYGIVKQTGGSLSVSSTVGRGTTFSILLPASAAEDAAAREPKREDKPRRQDLTGSATILLAEDEEAIRLLAARALSNKGYRVVTAANGAEALEIVERDGEGIDLLLTDVVMPEMDGPALVEAIGGRFPHLKVVFMSGYADAARSDSIDARGPTRFIHKPFTLKILAQTVKEALQA